MTPLDRVLAQRWLPWALVALAIVLRVGRYMHNPAIWLDEGMLASSVLNRSYLELLEPLDYRQGAPLGFLWLVKTCTLVLGLDERSLRLLPLVAGIVSPFLFYAVARRSLSRHAVPIALLLFAVSEPLIRYASEFKQYSLDVAVALLLVLVTIGFRQGEDRRRVLVWALAGAAAIWFSHTAVFVLAGLGTVAVIQHILRREWRDLAGAGVAIGAWLASFAVNYALLLRNITSDSVVRAWWSAHYMPLLPTSPSDAKWFLEHFAGLFEDPVGLTFAGLAGVLFLIGVAYAWRESWASVALLLAPVLVSLAASALGKYPFATRFQLFAAPLLILFIANGFESLRAGGCSAVLRGLVLAVLAVQPVLESLDDLVMPDTDQGIRPAMNYLGGNYLAGDKVYVYHWANPPFAYYVRRDGYRFDNVTVGASSRNDWSWYVDEIDELRGSSRVWFVFTPVAPHLGEGEEQFFLTHLDAIGERTAEMRCKWSSVYRYDLRPAEVRGAAAVTLDEKRHDDTDGT